MKLNAYLFLLLVMAFFESCDDQLNVVLEDYIDAEVAVTSLDDLEVVLTGAYSTLRDDGLYAESLLYLPDVMSDNLRIGNTNGGSFRTQANWQYSADNDIETWSSAYTLIFRANTVIGYIEQFEDGAQKNRIIGQALALRALGHFEILRYYAEDYNRNYDEPGSGIPVITFNSISTPPRNTVKEVYDQIFEDLLSAQNMLADVDEDVQANGPYYMDQRAVNALLARVSLYAEEWQDAIDYASLVINASSLASPVEYAAMWEDTSEGELLFGVSFATRDEGTIGEDLAPISNLASFTLSLDMAELYDEGSDIRYDLFVFENPNSNPGDDVFLTSKYPGRGGEVGLNHAKVLRVSEMYLIRAEAYTHLTGQDALAMADLNALRASRISGYTDENLSGTALTDAIQVERRKELVAEGHRWFDLRRIGQGVSRGEDCRGLTINCTLAAGDYHFVYPVPQWEMAANDNMTQNDNY